VVTNNGKDRSLCANLSAAKTFTEDHLEVPENKSIIENASFYLVTVSIEFNFLPTSQSDLHYENLF
jgi:hypothetical protein